MAQGRSLLGEIIKNFLASLTPKKVWGELRGKDYMGTEYYECERSQGSRRPARWFQPAKENNFEQELPPEWMAWLQHRRKNPPTEEEIQTNLLKMRQTIEKAKMLEKQTVVEEEPTLSRKFPVYEEYSLGPHKNEEKKQ